MHIETVRFERVFDVYGGLFSFQANGKREFAVVFDHKSVPTAGSTFAVALSEPGNWQNVIGWRDLATSRIGLKRSPWFIATDLLLETCFSGIALLAAAWVAGGPLAALVAFIALVVGSCTMVIVCALRNRRIRRALLAVSPDQARAVTAPDTLARRADPTASAR
jgi:hypothetical protein